MKFSDLKVGQVVHRNFAALPLADVVYVGERAVCLVGQKDHRALAFDPHQTLESASCVFTPETFGDLAVGDLLQFRYVGGPSGALDRVVYKDNCRVILVDEADGDIVEMEPSETLASRKRVYVGNTAGK